MTPPNDPKTDPQSVDYAALAQRYMDLWQEQAAKLAQDPSLTTGMAAAWSKMAAGAPFPFPNPAAPHAGFTTPTDGAKTAAAPPRDGGVDIAALLRRIDELERRVAVLESAKPAAAAGSGARALAESHPSQANHPPALDPAQLINAVTDVAKERFRAFATGVARYQNHPSLPLMQPPPVVWQAGAASVRDYGGDGAPVLVVPSLINRSTVLDLAPDRSLLRTMAAANLHTFLLDWGVPGDQERRYSLDDYIVRVLIPAIVDVALRTNQPVRLVGYCMGGTLATAAAVLAPAGIAKLGLIATPWDFHVGMDSLRAYLATMRPVLEGLLTTYGEAPFDLIQTLFASIDPALCGRKFRKFAALDPSSDEARQFVMLEDWLNDPVPLTAEVARQCFFDWYGVNTPVRGLWQVGGTTIDPKRVSCPTLVMIPSRDRIVPPESAEALARVLPHPDVRKLPLGHIGMMASSRAAEVTYAPLIAWLKDA